MKLKNLSVVRYKHAWRLLLVSRHAWRFFYKHAWRFFSVVFFLLYIQYRQSEMRCPRSREALRSGGCKPAMEKRRRGRSHYSGGEVPPSHGGTGADVWVRATAHRSDGWDLRRSAYRADTPVHQHMSAITFFTRMVGVICHTTTLSFEVLELSARQTHTARV
jgi:hypothetical protein